MMSVYDAAYATEGYATKYASVYSIEWMFTKYHRRRIGAICIPHDAYFDVMCIQYFYACIEIKQE